MNHQEIQKQYLLPTYPNRGITITHGHGIRLYDSEDNEYLDCMSSMGVNILGHCNEEVNDVVKEQIDRLGSLHCSLNNDTRSDALLKLQSVLPDDLNLVYFCNSGAESVEAALKFAMVITGKNKFIAAKNGYHGKTLGALAATTSSGGKYQEPFEGSLQKFDFVEFNNSQSLKNTISPEHAAFIIEPVQGEGGGLVPSAQYLNEVSKICMENNVLLILDEIQTGMGRTGKLFAFEHSNFVPDILCLAKGLGAGVPVGATIIKKEFRSKIPRGLHTSTFGGNPIACAGICATLDYIEKHNILDNVNNLGNYFVNKLKKIKSPAVKEVRGQGLMIALELNKKAMPYVQLLQKKGILVIPSTDNIIRFLPPLIITKEEIDTVLEKVGKALVSSI